jgi:hypothetical protein
MIPFPGIHREHSEGCLPYVHPGERQRLCIDLFLELFADLEKGQSLGSHTDIVSRLRVSPRVRFVGPDDKTAEAPYFNPSALLEFIGEPVKNKTDDVHGFFLGQVFLFAQGFDQFRLIHDISPFNC